MARKTKTTNNKIMFNLTNGMVIEIGSILYEKLNKIF